MHSAIAFSLSLLALTASAAPARRDVGTVQVQFANDVTGANGNARIPLDGNLVSLGQAYGNTNLEKDGTLLVTSLQFTADFQNVECVVLKDAQTRVANIADPHQDFQKFSQKPLDWQNGFAIACNKVTPTRDVGTVQVQFANDITGANGNARIPLDGNLVNLGQAYGNTNLERDGTLFVTSLQFTADFQNVQCVVLKDAQTRVADIADPHQDFQRFSQKPLDWQNGFAIACNRA